MNSTRWFVALREPIDVGRETAEYETVETLEKTWRRRLVGNAGFWILAGGFVVGLMILLNGSSEAPPPLEDRTPAEAVGEANVPGGGP